jgi:hypothetical protein
MSLRSDLSRLNLRFADCPLEQADKEHLSLIYQLNGSLSALVARYADGLALRNFCNVQSDISSKNINRTNVWIMHENIMLLSAWSRMAERDLVFTAWDFKTTVIRIKMAREKSVSLRKFCNVNKLETVIARFDNAFPNVDAIRNAYAHTPGLSGTKGDRKRNAKDGPYSNPGITLAGDRSKGNMISGSSDDLIYCTIYGSVYDMNVGPTSLATIIELYKLAFDCLSDAFKDMDRSYRDSRIRILAAIISRSKMPSMVTGQP